MRLKPAALLPAALLLSASIGAAGCAKRPVECAPALADKAKALAAEGAFALDARRKAADLVERALGAAATQDERFGVLRDYADALKLCAEAAQAITVAEAEVGKAKATMARIQAREGEAERVIASLDTRLALARGLADSGVVDKDADLALRKVVQAGADAKRELDRARAEQRGSGYALDLAAFNAAADRATRVIDDVRSATLAITEQVAARCRLRLDGVGLAEASIRSHAEWILLSVPGPDRHRILVLKVDRDKKTCAALYDRPASRTAIEDLEGTLMTWSIPGTLQHRLLVSFGKTSAWFLEGARFTRHEHLRAAGFPKVCAGHVTCSKPRATPRTIESDCECEPPTGSRLLPSEVSKLGRFVWDGSRVNAEP